MLVIEWKAQSLVPLLFGDKPAWRDTVFAEIDYGDRGVRQILGMHPYDCRGYMIKKYSLEVYLLGRVSSTAV